MIQTEATEIRRRPKYEFDIIPYPAPRMTQSDKWAKRDRVTKYFAFRDEFILKSNLNGFKLSETLKIVFVIPMPETWTKKKKIEMNFKPHQQKPDIDNLTKSILDSFNKDDGFVFNIHAIKYWGKKGKILVY
jgi:Holliday junction resolvase RusA-like endonuclease